MVTVKVLNSYESVNYWNKIRLNRNSVNILARFPVTGYDEKGVIVHTAGRHLLSGSFCEAELQMGLQIVAGTRYE